MERRAPQEIHLHVVPRQVIAGGQPGFVELHGPVGGGEQPTAQPDFHVSEGWDDGDRVTWRHEWFNGSGDISIPFVGGPWLMALDWSSSPAGERPRKPGEIDKIVTVGGVGAGAEG
jgi:hypothetical protein